MHKSAYREKSSGIDTVEHLRLVKVFQSPVTYISPENRMGRVLQITERFCKELQINS